MTEVGGYSLRDDGMQPGRTIARSVRLRRPARRCRRRRHLVAKRLYTSRQTPTTEAGILIFSLNKLDVSLGDATSDDGVVVRIWEKPLILCTWGGALTMAIGGAAWLRGGGVIPRPFLAFVLMLMAAPALAVNLDEVLVMNNLMKIKAVSPVGL
nr:cytochrome c-type biogenesis CcmF C-terminal domain-containing protein [Rhizobium laguerreae]